jgi:hypothetical protein
MTKDYLKSLTDDELKAVHQEMYLKTQNQLKDDTQVNFKDISDLYALQDEVRIRGMFIQDNVIVKKKTKGGTTREARAVKGIARNNANRDKDIRYMLFGILLFLLGLGFTLASQGNYLYYGAIVTGLGFLVIGIYGLMRS